MSEDVVLGVSVKRQRVGNLKIEHFTVNDPTAQSIVQNLTLKTEVQEDTIDKLVDRNADWLTLEELEQVNKIKAALLQETVIEYLRLNDYIVDDKLQTIEVGIDDNLNTIVSAIYMEEDIAKGIQEDSLMSKEEAEHIESVFNITDNSIDIIAEAKKRIEEKKKSEEAKKTKEDD